jgi:hypothetical protein
LKHLDIGLQKRASLAKIVCVDRAAGPLATNKIQQAATLGVHEKQSHNQDSNPLRC